MTPRLSSSIFELISNINATTSIAAAWETYMAAARAVGLNYGLAYFMVDEKAINDSIIMQTLPPGWLENYVRKDYQTHDPLVRIGHGSMSPTAWTITDWDGLLTGKQIGWRDDNKSFGICTGLLIPDRRDGHLKVISLLGGAVSIDLADQKALYFAGLEMLSHMHELGLITGAETPPLLSPRERDCLHWIAAGKSDWEIGQILSISEKTVGTHIDRLKHKLGVATRAQAIVAALRYRFLAD